MNDPGCGYYDRCLSKPGLCLDCIHNPNARGWAILKKLEAKPSE